MLWQKYDQCVYTQEIIPWGTVPEEACLLVPTEKYLASLIDQKINAINISLKI